MKNKIFKFVMYSLLALMPACGPACGIECEQSPVTQNCIDCEKQCDKQCGKYFKIEYSCPGNQCYCECYIDDAGTINTNDANGSDASINDADYFCIHYLNGDC